MVNEAGFSFLPAAKIAIFREFTRKSAIQKALFTSAVDSLMFLLCSGLEGGGEWTV